jgi:Lon protease-like protein
MFPLGSVLFPGGVLPLQVFEERYRRLVEDVRAGDGRFGVVLIERGSEVGGGDERTAVGTVAEIVREGVAEDGRILIVGVGRERIRVKDWLGDDPYPSAVVEAMMGNETDDRLVAALARGLAARRRLLALAVEMGANGQNLDLDLPDDPLQASWTLCVAAPLGSFDRQRLLETESAYRRMTLLEQMLAGRHSDLQSVLERG